MSTRSDVLRELLATPAVRELLRERLRTPEEPGLADVLWEDPDLTLSAVSAAPDRINRLARATVDVTTRLETMPDPVLREYVAELAGELDVELLGDALAAYARLVRRAGPEDLVQGAIDGLDRVDFGRVREEVEAAAEGGGEALEALAVHLAGDPVALANLASALPSLVNATLRVLGATLDAVDIPPEVKASTLFSLIDQIDPRQLGVTLDGLARALVEIHEGSLVLGKDEPRFADVLDRLAQGLLDHTDPHELGRAAVVLAEDLETALGITGELLERDPRLAAILLSAYLGSVHAVMRGAATALERAGELPEEALDTLADVVDRQMEPRTAGRLLGATATLTQRVLQRRPELADQFGRELARSLDGVQLLRLAWAVAEPAIRTLDAEELERHVERALLRGLDLARERPDLVRAVLRPVITVARGAMGHPHEPGSRRRALVRAVRRRTPWR